MSRSVTSRNGGNASCRIQFRLRRPSRRMLQDSSTASGSNQNLPINLACINKIYTWYMYTWYIYFKIQISYTSLNLDHADMYGYLDRLDISEHIHTKPLLMGNFHGHVPRIRISWISIVDIHMDIQCGYPTYPNSHQVDHRGISTLIPQLSVPDNHRRIHTYPLLITKWISTCISTWLSYGDPFG